MSNMYKILSNILMSRLTPHAEEIIADHQHGFRRNRSTTDHILWVGQILEKKWENNEAAPKLFTDFKKAHVAVRREVVYNILIEFVIPTELARLTKMCLRETYSKVRVGKYFSDLCPFRNGLKQGDALPPFLLNFALGYAIKRVQVNQDGLK